MNGSFTLFSLFQAFHMYQISFQEATKLIYKSQKKKKNSWPINGNLFIAKNLLSLYLELTVNLRQKLKLTSYKKKFEYFRSKILKFNRLISLPPYFEKNQEFFYQSFNFWSLNFGNNQFFYHFQKYCRIFLNCFQEVLFVESLKIGALEIQVSSVVIILKLLTKGVTNTSVQ